MPTFQTTPLLPVVFPDQAVRMNKAGVGMFPALIPNQTMLIGEPSAWHDVEKETAMARVRNTKLSELGMLGKRNTTARSQRYFLPASQSSRENGKFEDGGYVTAGGFLRGGTGPLSAEGKAWVKRKMLQRVGELNAIDAGDYSSGNPNQSVDLTPNTNNIEQTLFQFIDQFEGGAFTGSMIESANRLQYSFLSDGAYLTAELISTYINILSNLQEQAVRVADVSGGTLSMKEDKKNIARTLSLTFERLIQFLQEIAKFVNEDLESRKRLVASVGKRVLPNIAQYATAIGDVVVARRPEPNERQTTYELVRAGTLDVRRRRPTAAEEAIYGDNKGPLPPAFYDPKVGFLL